MKNSTLKRISFFTILLVFSLILMSAWSTGPAPANTPATTEKKQTINPIIGDISFTSKYGCLPDQMTDENLRISTHFEYVENLLCQKDVSGLSPELRANREHLISLLQDYRRAGKFPRNYDYFGGRKPCFIDKDNTICAVGYLVEQTVNRQTAEYINSKFKYDEVLNMQDDLLDEWISKSGLTKEEVAMIQPSYGGGWPPPCTGKKVYVCRWSNCVWECKCINPNNVEHWQASGHPCDTTGNNVTGGGNGNDGGQGNYFLPTTGYQGELDEALYEVYPNPVSSSTSIALYMEDAANISLRIFDLHGKQVATIAEGMREEGKHEFYWNVEGNSPGIYLLRIGIGNSVSVEKISILQ